MKKIENKTRSFNGNKKHSNKDEYENVKLIFENYRKKMDNSDLANSFTRYSLELELLNKMQDLASSRNLSHEFNYIKKEQNAVIDKLITLGYKIDTNE